MVSIVKWAGGMTFLGKGSSNHWVAFDSSPEYGGTGAGVKPMELILLAQGACTAMDVVSILEKKKVALDDFWIELDADRSERHPKVLTEVRMKYVLVGDKIPKAAVEQAIKLSQEKYCSVGAMIKKAANVEYKYEIRKSKHRP